MYATHANDFSLDHDTHFSKDSLTTDTQIFTRVLHSSNTVMPCICLHGLGATQL